MCLVLFKTVLLIEEPQIYIPYLVQFTIYSRRKPSCAVVTAHPRRRGVTTAPVTTVPPPRVLYEHYHLRLKYTSTQNIEHARNTTAVRFISHHTLVNKSTGSPHNACIYEPGSLQQY